MQKRIDLAIRLVEERTRLNFSQADFAEKVGMSREGLRLYEAGQRGMSAEFLAQGVALGIDVQYVLTGVRSTNLSAVEEKTLPPTASLRDSASANVVGTVHSGATVHQINTQRHVTRTIAEVKPGEQHITDEQARKLMDLVNAIVETEAKLKTEPKTHRAVWASLNSHCKVTKYRLIKLEDFERAHKYLAQWLGRLNAMPSAPVKDGDAWRKRHYAYIKINSKSPEDEVAVAGYMKRSFGAASLSELSNDELEQVYRYVAGRRAAARKKSRA